MPKLTLKIDIGVDTQKFEFPPEFVDAATQFIATQTQGTPPVPKYSDVHSLVVAHIESLAESVLTRFPQSAQATAKAAKETSDATEKARKAEYKKATKV